MPFTSIIIWLIDVAKKIDTKWRRNVPQKYWNTRYVMQTSCAIYNCSFHPSALNCYVEKPSFGITRHRHICALRGSFLLQPSIPLFFSWSWGHFTLWSLLLNTHVLTQLRKCAQEKKVLLAFCLRCEIPGLLPFKKLSQFKSSRSKFWDLVQRSTFKFC